MANKLNNKDVIMKNSYFFLLIGMLLFAVFARASVLNPLLTPRDMITNLFSNVTVQNKTGSSIHAYGLYVNRLAYVSTANASCGTATILYDSGQTSGASVTEIPFQNNQIVQLGQNYLYNMVFAAIYYTNQSVATSPCSLPGCGWLTDTVPYYWCIYLGALAPSIGNTSSTANVPPFGYSANGAGYNYNLVTQYTYIGPITCNDQTLSCTVANVQNQAFPQ